MKITDEMLAKVPALQIGQWFRTDDNTDGWQIMVGPYGALQVHKLDRGTVAMFGFEAGMQAYIRAVLEAALAAAPPVEYAGLVERLLDYAKDQRGWHNIDDTCEEAADAITALEARAREAEEWKRVAEKWITENAEPRIRELEVALSSASGRLSTISRRASGLNEPQKMMISRWSDEASEAAIRARTQSDAPAQPEGGAS